MPRRDGYHTLGGCFVGIRKLADGSPDGMVGMSKPCNVRGFSFLDSPQPANVFQDFPNI